VAPATDVITKAERKIGDVLTAFRAGSPFTKEVSRA
jgi:hypothetical protein